MGLVLWLFSPGWAVFLFPATRQAGSCRSELALKPQQPRRTRLGPSVSDRRNACNTHRGPQMTRPAGQTQPPPLTLSLPEAQDLGPGTWTGKFTQSLTLGPHQHKTWPWPSLFLACQPSTDVLAVCACESAQTSSPLIGWSGDGKGCRH